MCICNHEAGDGSGMLSRIGLWLGVSAVLAHEGISCWLFQNAFDVIRKSMKIGESKVNVCINPAFLPIKAAVCNNRNIMPGIMCIALHHNQICVPLTGRHDINLPSKMK